MAGSRRARPTGGASSECWASGCRSESTTATAGGAGSTASATPPPRSARISRCASAPTASSSPTRSARAFPMTCGGSTTRGDPNNIRPSEEETSIPNITVQWYAGRTDQQKREIVAAITDAMVNIGTTTADQVHVVFQDVEKTNWGVNGKLASDR